jgi:hypothetical protein
MLLDIINVSVQSDFVLFLDFENGERRAFNMATYLDQKPWARLKFGNVFQGAFVENGTVTWPGNIDIDPETLYERSVLIGTTHNPQIDRVKRK